MANDSTRIIPLGGLGEIGKNMTVIECEAGLVIVDAGLSFPRDEHLGVDLVIPDFSYLHENRDSIHAVVITHGHEDHVGCLPFLLREIPIPEVWATKLTLGLIKSKLDEHGLGDRVELRESQPEGPPVTIGPFRTEFVRMAHSIPDATAVVFETPAGRIVHTGDYKLDHTPVDGFHTDLGKLAELGNRGVDLMLGDSTNAERPGSTPSEQTVGDAFRSIIPYCRGRVLIASFASNVHRMQQAIEVAMETDRKVSIIGRSLRKNMNIARSLGYIDVPEGIIVRPGQMEELRPEEMMILCTGSQGEPMSALTRMAFNDHQHVSIESGDTVVISAKPVPGNELRVHDTINRLTRSGAEVLHQEIAPVHVSGHGHADEIRTVISLLRPKNIVPVHGEFRMLAAQAKLAQDVGVPSDRIVLADNGSIIEMRGGIVRVTGEVDAGLTFIDGLGVGDVKEASLRDRRHLSEDGVLIVVVTLGGENGRESDAPEIISRGFAEPGPILDDARSEVERTLAQFLAEDVNDLKLLQEHIHDSVGRLIVERTGRRPMILPVVVEG